MVMGYVALRKHSWLIMTAAGSLAGLRGPGRPALVWTMKPCKGASSKEITGLVGGRRVT